MRSATPRDGAGEACSLDRPPNLTNHTFDEVASARGKQWAEATIKALHQRERAQAVQIMQLKRDLENVKGQLATARREEGTRRRGLQSLDAEGEGGAAAPEAAPQAAPAAASAAPATGVTAAAAAAAATRRRSNSQQRAFGSRLEPAAAPSPSRRGSAAPSCSADAPVAEAEAPAPAAAEASDDGAQQQADVEALLERLQQAEAHAAALSEELAQERSAHGAAQEETRTRLATIRQEERERYEQRLHTSTSVQRSLEARLADLQEQLGTAQAKLHEQTPRPPSVGTRRELAALQRENTVLTGEVEGLREEVGALRGKLLGFNGKLRSLNAEFSLSEQQANAEERQLAAMLGEVMKEQRDLERENSEMAHTLAAARRERLKQAELSRATATVAAALGAGHSPAKPRPPPAGRSRSLDATPRGASLEPRPPDTGRALDRPRVAERAPRSAAAAAAAAPPPPPLAPGPAHGRRSQHEIGAARRGRSEEVEALRRRMQEAKV